MEKATWIQSTPERQWEERNVSAAAGGINLALDGGRRQKVDGFGCCFSELGHRALAGADANEKREALRRLFAKDEMGFSYCRVPIGANDFAKSWYSLNEAEGDYAMEHFTIERDKGCLIPYIKEARSLGGEFTLFASPWSPPTWMKFPPVYNYGTLIWEPKNLEAYALYFQKFVETYAAEGIRVDQIHVQNEPMADQKFPSCLWTGAQMRDFIRDYLGPRFERERVPAEIWLGTINTPFEAFGLDEDWRIGNYGRFALTALTDEKARRYIKGVAYQWGGKHAVQQTHMAFPELKMIQSECECGDGKNAWSYAEYIFYLMWSYFTNGVRAFVYWNLALEDGVRSTWGWAQNSLVSVKQSGEVVYNPDYYVLRHFARYIRPGATLLGLRGALAGNALAFKNADGTLALLVHNPLHDACSATFDCGGKLCSFEMPPHSFHTVVFEK